MSILYVDDACLVSPSNTLIDHEIKSLQSDYDLTNDGELNDYLGTRFTKLDDGSVKLTMPRMLDRIFSLYGNENDEA